MLAKRVPELRPSNTQNLKKSGEIGGEISSVLESEFKTKIKPESPEHSPSIFGNQANPQYSQMAENGPVNQASRTERQGLASILSDQDLIEFKQTFQKKVEWLLETEEVSLVNTDFSAHLCLIHYLISKSFDLEILSRSSPFTFIPKEMSALKLFNSLDELLKVTGEFMNSAGQLTCKKHKWLAETNAQLISKLLDTSTHDSQQNRKQATAICHLMTSFYQNLRMSLQVTNCSLREVQDNVILSKNNLQLAEKMVEIILKWVLLLKQNDLAKQSESSGPDSDSSDEERGSETAGAKHIENKRPLSLNRITSLIQSQEVEVQSAPKSTKDFCLKASARHPVKSEDSESAETEPKAKNGRSPACAPDQRSRGKPRRQPASGESAQKPRSRPTSAKHPVQSEATEAGLQLEGQSAPSHLSRGSKVLAPRSPMTRPCPGNAPVPGFCDAPKGPNASKKRPAVGLQKAEAGPASKALNPEPQKSAAQRVFNN